MGYPTAGYPTAREGNPRAGMENSTARAGQEQVSKAENRLCHDSQEEQSKVHHIQELDAQELDTQELDAQERDAGMQEEVERACSDSDPETDYPYHYTVHLFGIRIDRNRLVCSTFFGMSDEYSSSKNP